MPILGYLPGDLANYHLWLSSPVMLVLFGFQVWMFIDAIRREEWLWAILIFFFSVITAVLYFFLVYRQAAPIQGGRFEWPGAQTRRRIRELEHQIHHLDRAHHHSELGDLLVQRGQFAKAEKSYRNAMERDPEDPDPRGRLGRLLVRMGRPAEAVPLLEKVCAENPRHDYGETMMALAEAYMALKQHDLAQKAWEKVLEENSYARARVQLAEILLLKQQPEAARAHLREVLSDDAHAPDFQRKRDRVWVKRAKKLLRDGD